MRTLILTIRRRQLMAEALANELGHLKAEVFTGIDGAVEKLKKKFSKRHRRFIGRGELACRAGHLQILQKFLASRDDAVCILEDDIQIEKSNFSLNLLKNLREPYIWILGGQQGLERFRLCYGRFYCNNVWEIEGISCFFIHRSCCYITNRAGANLIRLMHDETITVYDDWSLFHQKGGRIFYSPYFKHPVSLDNSLIEADRASIVSYRLRNLRIKAAAFLFAFNKIFGKKNLYLLNLKN